MQFGKADKKGILIVILSVLMMGFCLSFLNRTDLGTDPATVMNLGISSKLGISLGNFQAVFNCFLLLFVFLFDKSQIGWGTFANMFLVGYSFDFFTWLNGLWVPEEIYQNMTGRILIMIPSLLLFILAAATYMAIQLGTSPYDAIPFLISVRISKVPFRLIRILWDLAACVVGVCFGAKLGIVSLMMAFALGPVVAWVRKNIVEKYLA